MPDTIDISSLKAWFLQNKRDFPWRQNKTPYKVWISEVMLQQTRATSVIPYFIRWMEKFPTIQDLAAAPFSEVIKMWEGLGYYSRVRNIHLAAKEITEKYQDFPHTKELLQTIKGFGPYTIGALLAFGFQKKAAAVDANVARVIARFLLIEEDVSQVKTKRKIEGYVESLLEKDKKPWIITEALIELGALLCQKNPRCLLCPIRKNCQAFLHSVQDKVPITKKKEKAIFLQRVVAVIRKGNRYLLQKGAEKKIMADLYEFPYFSCEEKFSIEEVSEEIEKRWGINGAVSQEYGTVKQSFTKYRVELYPFLFEAIEEKEVEGFFWVSLSELQKLPFSSGHRKIRDAYLRADI